MRNYPAKLDTDRDGRMERAARLRAEGKSLREIGADLRISAATAMRDLRRTSPRPLAAHLVNPLPGREYQRAMRATPGLCQMCGRPASRQVDHCHRHIVVRGLVCPSCNCSMQMVDSEIGIVLLLIDDYAPYARRCPGCLGRIDRVLYLLRDEPVRLRSICRFKPPGVAQVRAFYDQVRPLLRDDDTLTTADIAGKLGGSA